MVSLLVKLFHGSKHSGNFPEALRQSWHYLLTAVRPTLLIIHQRIEMFNLLCFRQNTEGSSVSVPDWWGPLQFCIDAAYPSPSWPYCHAWPWLGLARKLWPSYGRPSCWPENSLPPAGDGGTATGGYRNDTLVTLAPGQTKVEAQQLCCSFKTLHKITLFKFKVEARELVVAHIEYCLSIKHLSSTSKNKFSLEVWIVPLAKFTTVTRKYILHFEIVRGNLKGLLNVTKKKVWLKFSAVTNSF